MKLPNCISLGGACITLEIYKCKPQGIKIKPEKKTVFISYLSIATSIRRFFPRFSIWVIKKIL